MVPWREKVGVVFGTGFYAGVYTVYLRML